MVIYALKNIMSKKWNFDKELSDYNSSTTHLEWIIDV